MSNIYLTPAFLEEQKRAGVQPDTIADFIAAKIPEFKSQYTQVRSASMNDPRAIESFLNWKIYGTANPDPSIIAQPLPPEEEAPEPGFFGRIGERIGQAGLGVNQALSDYQAGKQGALDTVLQSAGNITSGILAPATEAASTVVGGALHATGLDQKLAEGAGALAQTGVGKAAAGAYHRLEEAAPQQMQTFKAVGKAVTDAADVYGSAKLAQGVGKGVAGGVKDFMGNGPTYGLEKAPQTDPALVQKLVQPKATKAVIQEAGVKNPKLIKKGGLFKSGELLPSKAEQALAKTAETIPGFGQTDDVVENANKVYSAKKEASQGLLRALQENDAALSHKEMNSAVNKAIERVAADFPGEEAQVRRIGEIWKHEAAKYPGKASGHWQSRIGFDDLMESRYQESIFQKGTARAEAVRAVRQTANDLIDKAAKGKFKPEIKRISEMYDILHNMKTKMGEDTLRSGASQLLRSPVGKAAATAAVGAGLGAAGINLLKE